MSSSVGSEEQVLEEMISQESRLTAEPKPLRIWGWRHYVGAFVLKLFGWKPEANPPSDIDKYVFIAAPHTSAWDFPFMIAFAWWWGVDIRWLGKHVLFEGPFGWFFRWFRGMPVDRRQANNLVGAMTDTLKAADELVLVIPAEGTRGFRDYWKSGFYWAAKGAGVPICLGYMDFARKRGGFGPMLYPSDDIRGDMDIVRAFYKDVKGHTPAKFSRIRLRQEDDEAAPQPE
ncbi:MAG: 1-acyl-sn-glycerol-3-phosphate acyltransferase [Alphaproteobacteria bacterium]|nr:1-acyl-sn-glycerol-3-phosphate acyltransferase [Alphaproteobacteria bacterium]